jgi:RHS repeat-associated protein
VLDVSQCVADCFETTFGYSTPAYISLDVPRSVTLLYRSGRASPYGRVTLGAIDGNASVTSFRLQLADPNGVNVTFTNGATSLFFARKSGDTTRLAAEFDASTIATSAGLYTASVTSYAGSTPLGTTAKAVRIIVVNDRASVYGAGVDIVGVQRLFTVAGQSPGVLVTDGSGSASFFAGSCTTSSACSFTSPGGEFSTLTTVVGAYKRTYPDGTVVTFTSAGLDTSVVDRFGTRTRYAWVFNSDAGKTVLSTITDPTGQVTSFTYRNTGNAGGWKLGALAAITTPGGRSANVGVQATTGDLRLVNDADGLPFARLGYDAQHRLVADTNKANGVSSYNYAYGKTLSYVDAPTVVLAGNVPARPRVQVREMYAGLYAAADVDSGTSTTNAIKVPTVDIRAAVTDPRGNSTFYTLGRFGSPTRIDAPLTNPAYVTYDTLTGQVTRSVSPTGAVTRFTWTNDQLRSTTDSLTGRTINVEYKPSYSLPSHIYGDVAEQWFTYDSTKTGWPLLSSRIGSSSAPATIYTLDAFGRPTSVKDPGLHTTSYGYELTGLRNHTSVTAPNLQSTTFLHDAYGRDTLVKDPRQYANRSRYDVLNRVTWTLSPLGGDSTTIQYDALNNPTVVRDAKGQVFTTQRNALGWVVQQIDPALHADSAAYDIGGNVVYTKSRQGRVDSVQYDALGRVTKKFGVTSPEILTYAYDPSARWVYARVDSGGTLISADTVVTDSLGRTVREFTDRGSPGKWRVLSQYNTTDPGRSRMTLTRLSVTPPTTENDVTYSYDASKRLSGISVPFGNTTIGYNTDNLPATVTFPSGMIETTTYTPNHASAQRSYSVSLVDSLLGRWYVTDSLARLVKRGGKVRYEEYGYDPKGQLGSITKKHYANTPSCTNIDGYGYSCTSPSAVTDSFITPTYDLVGNPNDAGTVVDPGNRLRTFKNVTMTYDLDGNMLTRTANGVTDTYTWNDFGQLRSVSRTGRAQPTTFRYDGFGRRIQKTSIDGTVNYIWDGQQITAEVDTNGVTQQSYSYNPGVDQPRTVAAGGQVYFMSTEPGGDVNGLFLRGAVDTVKAQYAYSAWGEVTTDQPMIGTRRVNSFRWRGLAYDDETGLYQVRARYYDPATRRFLSEDPIGLSGGINLFAYGSNDPLNARDPSGLDWCYQWYSVSYDGEIQSIYRVPVPCPDEGSGIGDSPWGDPTTGRLEIPPGSVAKTLTKLARDDADNAAADNPWFEVAIFELDGGHLQGCRAGIRQVVRGTGTLSGEPVTFNAWFKLEYWLPDFLRSQGTGYYSGAIRFRSPVSVYSYNVLGEVNCETGNGVFFGYSR